MEVRLTDPRRGARSRRAANGHVPASVGRSVALNQREVVAPKGALCFGCNQGFEGNPVAVQFDSDLVPETARSELKGLLFHRGHLHHYARRRGWTELAAYLAGEGPSRF